MPEINLKTDNHIHTRLCNHASGDMEEYVKAAIAKGLESITFLEHLEAEIEYFERTWLTEDNFRFYFDEGRRLCTAYQDDIQILLGVEVGYNPHGVDQIKEQLNRYEWDMIGVSYHFFFDGKKHLNMVSRRPGNIDALAAIGPDKIVSDYFAGLIDAVQRLDGDVLCHMDAVMRHYPGLEFKSSHWEQIDQLLDGIRDKGMKLEINTSGFAIRNMPYPNQRIIRKALERGISLVAGSDAHRPEQVGRYFERLPEYFRSL